MGAALVTLSFALMFMLPLLPVHAQLALIALSAIGFDLGLQSSPVAHQNSVYGLEPQARGRLNALLFTVVFIGMSLGRCWAVSCTCWPAGTEWSRWQ